MIRTGSLLYRRLLLASFFIFSAIFLVLLPAQPYPGSFLIKAVPAVTLAVLAFTGIPGLQGTLLGLGLLFSAGGDIALDLDRGDYFVVGLALFLMAHLFYIATFLQDARLERARWAPILLLLLYSAALAYLLWSTLAELRLPVMLYIVVITTMGVIAALRPGPGAWLVLAGAFLFILSDSLIAVDKFLTPVSANRYAVMITYYAAQFLIAYGLLGAGGRASP